MSSTHPPADRRCQIYITVQPAPGERGPGLDRCRNEGDHWEKWGGCSCGDPDPEVCEGDFYSWECDGNHAVTVSA